MAEEKEKKERTLQRTYRLPAEDVHTIEDLARHGMLGSNRSAVVRTLLSAALKDLTQLSPSDRTFVFSLIDALNKYEKETTTENDK